MKTHGTNRVVTRYMGSGINDETSGGIRDHSAGISDHKPWDRDQYYHKGIRVSHITTKTTKF